MSASVARALRRAESAKAALRQIAADPAHDHQFGQAERRWLQAERALIVRVEAITGVEAKRIVSVLS